MLSNDRYPDVTVAANLEPIWPGLPREPGSAERLSSARGTLAGYTFFTRPGRGGRVSVRRSRRLAPRDWMAPDIPVMVGKAASTKSFQTAFDAMRKMYGEFKFGLTADLVRVAGDWAWIHGGYTWTATPKAGKKPRELPGKWLGVYQRQPDGSWEAHVLCWNANQFTPLPPAPRK